MQHHQFMWWDLRGFQVQVKQLRVVMSLTEQLQIRALRTRELRELLEDDDKINLLISCCEKFQKLQRAGEAMLVSNQKMAQTNLSLKPKFEDIKKQLAVKYKELEKLKTIIRVKQDQLAETHSVHHVQLRQNINHTEDEFKLLFERFTEGKTDLEDLLDSFIISQKLHHISLYLVLIAVSMYMHVGGASHGPKEPLAFSH